jgi:transposase-like protein
MPNLAFLRRPPFCPNPDCDSRTNPTPWRFQRKGFYPRSQPPHRIQRYRCSHCGRYFSSQTFATTYWLKRPRLLELVFHRLVACSALRQIAREHQVSHSTIRTLSDRLGRHCLLFHERLRPKTTPAEPLVLDGFRTFEHSQYWPMDVNLVVGPSLFVYGFNDVELRRSGTMRPAQRARRAVLERQYGRPDPDATRKRVEALLRRVIPAQGEVVVRSDEHPAYVRAIARLRDRTIVHERTSSKAARTTRNPLFAANLSDLLIRHSSANHKRETIAFSKRRQSALYRLAVWVVWRNYMKGRSENRRIGPPAMALGLIDEPLAAREILQKRLFPEQVLPDRGWLRECFFGRIPTRAIARCASHRAKYAV